MGKNENNLLGSWVGFYLPPFFLAYEVIYHLASGSPLIVGPMLVAAPVFFQASIHFAFIMGGQVLIFEYASSLTARIIFSLLLCALTTTLFTYYEALCVGNGEMVIKGGINSALWSPVITLPITIFFLYFVHGRSGKDSDK